MRPNRQTPERFPLRMRQKNRWLGWIWGAKEPSGRWVRFPADTLEPHDGHMWHRGADGTLEGASKLPKSVRTMRAASVSDPSTWGTFEAALDALRRGDVDGLGYVLDDGEALVDLDGCVANGELDGFSRAVVAKLDSYAEFSVSGQGVHIVCVADGFTPDRGQKGERVEVYVGGHTNRYCTVSGDVLDGCDELNDDAEDVLADLYQTEFADRPPVAAGALEQAAELTREIEEVELTADDERAVAWMFGHYKHGRALFNGDYLGWADDREKRNNTIRAKREAGYDLEDNEVVKDSTRSGADFALASYLLAATEGDPNRTLALLDRSKMWRPKYAEIHDGKNRYDVITVATALRKVDPAKMRLNAYERRDARLDTLVGLCPDLNGLADLMRRDDVTDMMLRRVMAYHATGSAQQEYGKPLHRYSRELIGWIVRQWPRVVELAYTPDIDLGGD